MNAWQHQADAIEFVQSLEAGSAGVGAGLFMDMGTGKTKVALELLRDRGTYHEISGRGQGDDAA